MSGSVITLRLGRLGWCPRHLAGMATYTLWGEQGQVVERWRPLLRRLWWRVRP